MAALKSLTFTTLPTPRADPTLDRRARTIARLEEQKLLLKDPNYTRTVRTWVRKRREINCENPNGFRRGGECTQMAPMCCLFEVG